MTDKPEFPTSPPPPEGKPLFLQPQAAGAAYVEAPPDPNDLPPLFDDEIPETVGTTEAGDDIPRDVRVRWLEIARLHALGHTNNSICRKLGYSASRVSIILHKPLVRKEVFRYRNKLYEQDVLTAMKDLGPDAIRVMTEVLQSEDGKRSEKLDAAKWLLEKLTGKPKQEVNVESNTLASFMDMLRQMQQTGERLDQSPALAAPSQQTIDVTPKHPEPVEVKPSKWASWVDENL